MISVLIRWLREQFSLRGRRPQPGGPRRHPFRLRLEQLEDRTVLTAYEVGPGQAYLTLGAVPWAQLAPGDTVDVHWQPQGYHEMILLSASGTAGAPIKINGIAGPNGQLPVIDGQNAIMGSGLHYAYPGSATAPGTPNRGVVIVSPAAGYTWGYKPSYIDISNLDIQGANASNTFTDNTGAVRSYSTDAAAIFVERGEHIVIRNCTLTDSGNGLFVASGGSEQVQSRDILVQGCNIYGNGVVGSDRQHNVYTEAIGITFEYNHLGPLRAGALGNNLKDRSAGTVIRYNWIEGGGHLLDLVDPQDSAPQATQDPNFHQTYVYGNILVDGQAGGATFVVHYGGDDGIYSNYRKGTLYFYNNTVVVQADQSNRWRTILFQLDTNDESVDARNNILYDGPATAGAAATEFDLLNTTGAATFGVNWVSPGWAASRSGVPFTGTVNGTNNFIGNMSNDPGFVSLAGHDFHLQAGSQAIDAAVPLSSGVPAQYAVTQQYVVNQGIQARPVNGAAPDLGAFEAAGQAPAATPGQGGTLQFDTTAYSVNSQWSAAAKVPVVRRLSSQGQVAVRYTVIEHTAQGDFIASGTVTFAAGQYTGWISIPLTKLAAGTKQVWDLTLTDPTGGAVLGSVTAATLTITG